MKAKRLEQVSPIFRQALELSTDERAAFLRTACAGDTALRHDVEQLISAHERAGSFIDSPAYEKAAVLGRFPGRPISPDGGTPRKIIEGGRNPNWSWDGKQLVFERGYDVWTANKDGSDQRRIDNTPPTDFLLADRMPAFSPNGSLVAIFQNEKGPRGDYWVIPVSGGEARRLTFDHIFGGAPVWTPDGQFIIFPSQRAGSRTLWKVPVSGGQPEAVLVSAGEDTEPEISRDGRRLIYTNTRSTHILMLTDAATLQCTQLADSSTYRRKGSSCGYNTSRVNMNCGSLISLTLDHCGLHRAVVWSRLARQPRALLSPQRGCRTGTPAVCSRFSICVDGKHHKNGRRVGI